MTYDVWLSWICCCAAVIGCACWLAIRVLNRLSDWHLRRYCERHGIDYETFRRRLESDDLVE